MPAFKLVPACVQKALSKHVKLPAGHRFDMLAGQGKTMDGSGHSLLERHLSGAGAHWTGFQLGDPGIVLSFENSQ